LCKFKTYPVTLLLSNYTSMVKEVLRYSKLMELNTTLSEWEEMNFSQIIKLTRTQIINRKQTRQGTATSLHHFQVSR